MKVIMTELRTSLPTENLSNLLQTRGRVFLIKSQKKLKSCLCGTCYKYYVL